MEVPEMGMRNGKRERGNGCREYKEIRRSPKWREAGIVEEGNRRAYRILHLFVNS